MSEGQLKKRQLERLMLLYKNTKMPVFLNLARNVEADIDEAKKDLQKRLKEVGDVSPEEGLDVYYAWVTDWFGDST